jgi:Fe2+ or Zn2+ uptake regulation protein
MTIDYINKSDHMTMECDICGTVDEFDGTWQDCMNIAKRDGWKIKMHNDEWYHFCCDKCLEKL